MRLLLDTHVVIWWMDGSLAAVVSDRFRAPTSDVVVSAVSAHEIAYKVRLGRLRVPGTAAEAAELSGFSTLSISLAHADAAGRLPLHHRDPFDRLLIAQAQLEGLTIVTRDRAFAAYDVDVLPC
jgi:PIN domain nuclease of toxin-antitoxin system